MTGPSDWAMCRGTQIDHGYTLPSTFADVSFEWLYWPQARVPFSAATRAYIGALSTEADLATLAAHRLPLSLECERVFKASTMLLQKVRRWPFQHHWEEGA